MKYEIVNESQCTGCSACSYCCPHNAITMKYNKEGFLYSCIDDSLCIKCGKCKKICPVLNPIEKNYNDIKSYAVICPDDIRIVSSSGGAFTLFARGILESGGVCFGVTFDAKKQTAKYIAIDSYNDLERVRGSKYMPSDMTVVYEEIKALLLQRKVLFTGLPCQVAGLYAFLGSQEIVNLITIDLLCLGVPSQLAITKYFAEISNGKEIENINFREKRKEGKCDSICITFVDGTTYRGDIMSDSYEQAYHSRLLLRKSCEQCNFCEFPRTGDLSIGDFHGINEYDATLDDGKGCSIVFVNSDKGKRLFEDVKSKANICEEVPISASTTNRIINKVEVNPNRDRFYQLLTTNSFSQSVDKSLKEKYDIAVIGIHTVENHGSNLSYYALYRTLTDLGYDTLMVERPESSWWKPHTSPIVFKENPYEVTNISKLYPTKNSMRELNNRCDTFVLGSDQLWYYGLYDCFDQFCYLDYIYDNKNKIAYATSFGRDEFDAPDNVKAKVAALLKRFNSISLREKGAVETCEREFHITADWVLDPVFLCDRLHYDGLVSKSEVNTNEKYIATYILDPNKQKQQFISNIGNQLGYNVINMTDVVNIEEKSSCWDLPFERVHNEDWLKYIKNAELVITDSFHGTCFCIIYEKQFYSLVNEYRGKARFESLLSLFCLEDRMIYNDNMLESICFTNKINYTIVNEKVKIEKEKSMCWLKNAIHKEVQNEMSEFDIIGEILGNVNDKLDKYTNYVDQHGHVLGAHDERMGIYDKTFTNIFQMLHTQQELQSTVKNDLVSHTQEIGHQVIELNDQVKKLNDRIAVLEVDINHIQSSYSYRIGRLITFIPRKIYNIIKSL